MCMQKEWIHGLKSSSETEATRQSFFLFRRCIEFGIKSKVKYRSDGSMKNKQSTHKKTWSVPNIICVIKYRILKWITHSESLMYFILDTHVWLQFFIIFDVQNPNYFIFLLHEKCSYLRFGWLITTNIYRMHRNLQIASLYAIILLGNFSVIIMIINNFNYFSKFYNYFQTNKLNV